MKINFKIIAVLILSVAIWKYLKSKEHIEKPILPIKSEAITNTSKITPKQSPEKPNQNEIIPSNIATAPISQTENPDENIDLSRIKRLPKVVLIDKAEIEKVISATYPVNKKWNLVGGISALSESQYREEMGTVVSKQNGYVFFKSNPSDVKNFNPSKGMQAAYNEKSKALGVVSGSFVVTYKASSEINGIAETHGLNVEKNLESMKTAILQAKEGCDILATLEKLKNDPAIEKVNLEILQNRVHSK